jgi:type I restriction enzyme S subunit
VKFYRETEFQETEIGKIPKDWKTAKLGEICEKIKAGGTPLTTKKEYWNGNIPFVKIEDMTSSGKYLMKTSSSITNTGLENSSAWLVPENSLLLAMYGSLGEVSINTIKVATSQAILAIIPKEKNDVEFLYYWFLYFKPRWRKYAKPTTQANLTAEIVRNSTIPLPSPQERIKIAEILSTVDKTLEDVDKTISRLERLKKALMGELLTGRIRIKEVDGKLTFYRETEFQETEIGKIPKDWKIKKLGELLEFAHGKRPEMLLTNSGIPIYGAGGFYGYTNTYLVNKPAILVIARVGKGSVGKVYLVRGSVWITDNAIYGYSKDPSGLTATYTYHWLIFDKNWVEKYVRRSAGGYAIITLDSIKNLKIPVPTIDEQTNIVNVIYLFTKVIELHHEEKIRLERLKRGLMHMLLTGKIRVRES